MLLGIDDFSCPGVDAKRLLSLVLSATMGAKPLFLRFRGCQRNACVHMSATNLLATFRRARRACSPIGAIQICFFLALYKTWMVRKSEDGSNHMRMALMVLQRSPTILLDLDKILKNKAQKE